MVARRALIAAAVGTALARPARAVVDGIVDPNTATSPFAGVGSLTMLGGGTYSAVAIAPRFALTAAHVVAGANAVSITFNINRGGDLTARLGVASVQVHPGFTGAGPGGLMRDDLAVLRLAEPLPFGTPTYELARRGPYIHERVWFVGYGNGSASGGPELPAHPAVKRIGSNLVEAVLADPHDPSRVEMYRFSYNPVPGGSVQESTLAGGDSGSPAFIAEAPRLLLVGINTYVYNSRVGRGGGGVVVAAHREWILSIVGS